MSFLLHKEENLEKQASSQSTISQHKDRVIFNQKREEPTEVLRKLSECIASQPETKSEYINFKIDEINRYGREEIDRYKHEEEDRLKFLSRMEKDAIKVEEKQDCILDNGWS
jgi:hypothetical protein